MSRIKTVNQNEFFYNNIDFELADQTDQKLFMTHLFEYFAQFLKDVGKPILTMKLKNLKCLSIGYIQ